MIFMEKTGFFMKKNRILALEVFQKSTFTEKAPARIKKKSASHAAWEHYFQK